jgi:hypothetical protein
MATGLVGEQHGMGERMGMRGVFDRTRFGWTRLAPRK